MARVENWLLPDGIEEILPPNAEHIEQLRTKLLDTLDGWGYRLVVPPALEYLDSLLTGVGHDLDLQTFKVTDQLSGRMMGLSADTTPQVARMDAHSLAESGTSRLSYCRTVFHTKASSLLASRTPMQMGAELFGDDSLAGDVEVIALMLETLQQAQVPSVHLNLGAANLPRMLAEHVQLDAKQQREWFNALSLKCASDIDVWADNTLTNTDHATLMKAFARLQGDAHILERALALLAELPAAMSVLERLQQVVKRIETHHPRLPITIDLTELRGHQYHTGIVFSAFVPGFGEALAKGGRYDDTGSAFGRARAAIGFSADLKCVAKFSQFEAAQKVTVIAPDSDDPMLWQSIQRLREDGKRVVTELGDGTMDGDYRLQYLNDQWQLVEA